VTTYTARTEIPMPTLQEGQAARETFLRREPRNLFYRAAIELIELARTRRPSSTIEQVGRPIGGQELC
jgi:hypothetical protein